MLRLFDAGMGDATVLSHIMRAMHRRYPIMPFLIVGKENRALVDEVAREKALHQERTRQIDMIIRVGEKLDHMSRVPMLSTTVRMMRGVANSAGFGELQSFLERGLAAFHKMRGPNEFLEIVRARELRIMDQLFRGAARPFAFE
mgnify:CR=1 FL=1